MQTTSSRGPSLFPIVGKDEAPAPKQGDSEARTGFRPPYRQAYQLGIYQAVSAIPDAYLVIDGPDCIIRKAQYLQGKHDWRATLLDVSGHHRLATTLLHDDEVIGSKGEMFAQRLRDIGAEAQPGVVFSSAMPHVRLIGTDYDMVARDSGSGIAAPILEVPSQALEGDYLDGYGEVLTTLAEGLPLDVSTPDPRTVAVIGHHMHRMEEDCLADARELYRLLTALKLDIASMWLDGTSTAAQLSNVAEAGLLLALPSGRRAAKKLAARTGARVLEVALPVGLEGTREFLTVVGEATGRQAEAADFIGKELRRVVPRLEFAISHVFVDRSVAFSGNPHLFDGMVDMVEELGMRLVHLSAPCHPNHAGLSSEPRGLMEVRPLYGVTDAVIAKEVGQLDALDVDLIVANSMFHKVSSGLKGARVEVGFPSDFNHALHPQPTLGFEGWLSLVDRMANALLASRRHAGSSGGRGV